MNKLNKIGILTLLTFFMGLSMMNAQVIINEISYNPCAAQGGDGDCEFIELYNSGTTTVDISNYSFTGVTLTFPLTSTIDPMEYIVVALNDANVGGCYTVPAGTQVFDMSGGLTNSGETIALLDDLGAMVDMFTYSGTCGANGDCNSLNYTGTGDNADCSVANWIANPPTPGAANITTAITSVEFNPSFYTIAENAGTVDVCVSITNPDAVNATTVEVSLTGGDATNGTDVMMVASPITLTFPAGSIFDQCFTVTAIDDATVEPNETLVFDITNTSAITGASSSATVTITDDDAVASSPTCELIISAAYDGPLTGGQPKGIELYVVENIPDLSLFALTSVANGAGTSGTGDYQFPVGSSASAGDYIYVTSDSDEVEFMAFFGFAPDFVTSELSINGDDAVELYYDASGTFSGGEVVTDVFGDVNTDGSGEPWDHLDGWAYRIDMTGPNGSAFDATEWTYSGANAWDGELTNATAASPMPIGTFTTTSAAAGCGASSCNAMEMVNGTSPILVEASTSITVTAGTTTLTGSTLYDAPCVEINGDFDTGSNEFEVRTVGCTLFTGETFTEEK